MGTFDHQKGCGGNHDTCIELKPSAMGDTYTYTNLLFGIANGRYNKKGNQERERESQYKTRSLENVGWVQLLSFVFFKRNF